MSGVTTDNLTLFFPLHCQAVFLALFTDEEARAKKSEDLSKSTEPDR